MKPVNKTLDDATIQSILKAERANSLGAEQSSDLSEQRIRNMDYYMGDMTDSMPANEGESSAVSTDVQDLVEGVLPIILDALSGSDKVVEFMPRGPQDEKAAYQETCFVNHVFYQQNDGFLTLHNAVKDALLSKNCYIKWWMESDEARTREKYRGLTEDAFAQITSDTEVSVIDTEQYADTDPATQQPVTYYNVITEAVKKKLRAKIAAFAPEEFLISKNAVNVKDAPYLAHVQRKPQADLISQFPDKEQVIRSSPNAVTTGDNYEAFARQTVQDNQDQLQTADDVNKDMRLIEVTEHYIRLALEEDKVARRYKITTVGTGADIIDLEEVTAWNIASGTPIIMPHRHFGRAVADLGIDIQEIKTSLLRATLNNAYYANNQRMEVSETHASENTIDDLLNNRVGGLVRTKMPGGLTAIQTQSIGGWVEPIIEYMDGVAAKRTGINPNNTAIDADSLNHARTGAVTRIMDAAEMRIKLMTRVFAETLIVDVFRGLHGMLQEFSEEKEVFQVEGAWVEVDPREWTKRDRMTVAMPLGGASKQQMLGFFAHMLTVQQAAMTAQGSPNGPLVSYQGIYKTLDDMVKLAGLKTAQGYFMQPPPPNPNAPPPPDPRMVEAQGKVDAQKAQTAANIQGDQAQAAADQQRDAQKFEFEQRMEQMKLQFKHQSETDQFAHKAALDKMKFEHESQMAAMKAGFELRLDAHKATEQIKIDKAQAAQEAKQGVGEV